METTLTSALIIRRSPGVAVCRLEKHTHMWLRCKAAEARRVDKMLLQARGKSLALLANSNNHKITFPAESFPHKETGFLSPLCSLLFFLLPSAAHNSEQYWWLPQSYGVDSVSRTGLHTPTALYAEYCTGLNCLTVSEQKVPPPPSFSQTGSQLRGFPSLFTLSILTSFFHFLSSSVIGYRSSPLVWSHSFLSALL